MTRNQFTVSAMFLCGVVTALADTRIVTRYIADGQTTVTTIYAKGDRLRYNYGSGESLLRECAENRIVQVDDTAKTYRSLPAEPLTAAGSSKMEVTDTGERKELFGYSARHLRVTETAEVGNGRTETDGWYIDLKGLPSCASPRATAKAGSTVDGFPASYEIATFGGNGRPSAKIAMQVTDLSAAPLDPALFEVPSAYKEAGRLDANEPATQKSAGATRVGVVEMRNTSHHEMQRTGMYNHMLAQLQEGKIDVVPLPDGPPDAIRAKARQSQCDYILFTELTAVDRPEQGKVRGLIHKTPVVGHATDGDAYEARVAYTLVPLAEGAATVASSVVAKTGKSFNWVGAASLASNFVPMAMAAKMLGGAGALNPAMLNALLRGGSMGNSMMTMDPLMGSMSMFLRAANLKPGPGKNAATNPPGMDAAIVAALEQEGTAILAELKK